MTLLHRTAQIVRSPNAAALLPGHACRACSKAEKLLKSSTEFSTDVDEQEVLARANRKAAVVRTTSMTPEEQLLAEQHASLRGGCAAALECCVCSAHYLWLEER